MVSNFSHPSSVEPMDLPAPVAKMLDSIPSEYHLPLVVVIGLIGFLFVVLLSKMSTKKLPEARTAKKTTTPNKSTTAAKKKATTTAAPEEPLSSPPPKTPPRRPRAKKDSLGTLETPSGRRSARIASRRKED